MIRALRSLAGAALLALPLASPVPVMAQDILTITDGVRAERLEIGRQRGYAALPASRLGLLGWRFASDGEEWVGRGSGRSEIRVRPGVPFVRVDGDWVQLVDSPFLFADELYLPVQLLVDVFPDRLSELYTADAAAMRVTVRLPELG